MSPHEERPVQYLRDTLKLGDICWVISKPLKLGPRITERARVVRFSTQGQSVEVEISAPTGTRFLSFSLVTGEDFSGRGSFILPEASFLS